MRHTLLILLSLVLADNAAAETRSFRCGNDLVNLGDSKATVQLRCGAPMAKDSFCKPQAQPLPGQPTPACEAVDEWTYNPGRGQFYTTLRFEAGQLQAIRYGDRVK